MTPVRPDRRPFPEVQELNIGHFLISARQSLGVGPAIAEDAAAYG